MEKIQLTAQHAEYIKTLCVSLSPAVQNYFYEFIVIHCYTKGIIVTEACPTVEKAITNVFNCLVHGQNALGYSLTEYNLMGITCPVPFPQDLNWLDTIKVQLYSYLKRTYALDSDFILKEMTDKSEKKDLFTIDLVTDRQQIIRELESENVANQFWIEGPRLFLKGTDAKSSNLTFIALRNGSVNHFDVKTECMVFENNRIDSLKIFRNLATEFIELGYTPHYDTANWYYGKSYNLPTVEEVNQRRSFDWTDVVFRDYQKIGIDVLLQRKKTLLADDMGLGKTFQYIGAIHMANAYPCVVVVPKTMYYDTIKAWETVTKETPVHISKIKSSTKVVVTTYTMAHEVLPYKERFKSIVLDESHYIKNQSTQRYKICFELAADKEYKILCSGTPLVNHTGDLIAPLVLLGYLTAKTAHQFKREFGGKEISTATYSRLYKMLHSTCMVRRLKKDVETQLPEKIRNVLTVELPAKYTKVYNKAYMDLETYLKDYKFYTDEQVKKAARAQTLVMINELRQIIGEACIPYYTEMLEILHNNEEPAIVFSPFVSVLKDLEKELKKLKISCVVVDGSSSGAARNKAFEDFKNGTYQMLLITYGTGSEGLTFTHACNVIHAGKPWTPLQINQGTDRTHRIGQTRVVNEYTFDVTDTIDIHMSRILKRKELTTTLTVGTEKFIENVGVFDQLVKELFDVTF